MFPPSSDPGGFPRSPEAAPQQTSQMSERAEKRCNHDPLAVDSVKPPLSPNIDFTRSAWRNVLNGKMKRVFSHVCFNRLYCRSSHMPCDKRVVEEEITRFQRRMSSGGRLDASQL